MNRFEPLRARLREVPGRPLELPGVILRESAVLVPLIIRRGEALVLFTRRPTTLRKHAGQISFPGGSRDPEDATPLHTALRESEEELAIPRGQVDVLGMLDEIATPSGFRIVPFVGLIPPDVPYLPSEEVAEIIEAPLEILASGRDRRVERRMLFGKVRELYFYDHGPHVIWGATAHILTDLLRVLEQLSSSNEGVNR